MYRTIIHSFHLGYVPYSSTLGFVIDKGNNITEQLNSNNCVKYYDWKLLHTEYHRNCQSAPKPSTHTS